MAERDDNAKENKVQLGLNGNAAAAVTTLLQKPGLWGAAGITILVVMQLLNPQLQDIKDGITSLKEDVSKVSADVAAVKLDVASVKDDVSDVSSDVAAVQSDVADVKLTIGRLEGTTIQHSAALGTQAATIEQLSKELAFQTRLLSNARVNIGTLQGTLKNLSGHDIVLAPAPVRQRHSE